MKAIKDKLKVWNNEEFGNVNEALKAKEDELHNFDLVVEERQLNPEEKAVKCKASSEFRKLSWLTESLWDRNQGSIG